MTPKRMLKGVQAPHTTWLVFWIPMGMGPPIILSLEFFLNLPLQLCAETTYVETISHEILYIFLLR